MAKISIFNGRISTVRNYDVTCDLWWNTDCFDNRLIIWIQLPSCEYFLISIDIIWSKQMISLVSDWENNLQMSISPRLQLLDVRKTSSREIKMFLNMRGLPLDMSSISFTSSNIAASITGSHTNTNIFWKVCWWLIQTSKILSKNHFLSAGMTFISYSDIGLFRSLWFPSLASSCFSRGLVENQTKNTIAFHLRPQLLHTMLNATGHRQAEGWEGCHRNVYKSRPEECKQSSYLTKE